MGNCCPSRQANTQDPVPVHNQVQFANTRRTEGQNLSPVPKYEIGESSRSSSKHVTRPQQQVQLAKTHRTEGQNLSAVTNGKIDESSSKHVTQPQQESAEPTFVAAIDFGTTFSGYAFSFRHEYKVNPLKISCNRWEHSNGFSDKAPTSILFGPDGQVEYFGYDAHRVFNDEERKTDLNNRYFFDRFKMKLFQEKHLTVDTMLKDISGKKMKAIDVFSGTIDYMKNHLLDRFKGIDTANCLSEREIHWVITVPAIWNDKAKQFMRKSAEQAGIPKEQLTLALEPEAASLLCRRLPNFHSATSASGNFSQYQPMGTGTKYMVLDLGGGTADFTVHKVSKDGKLQEIHEASGGDWGGTTVDREFFSVMDSVFGNDKMNLFKQKHPNSMLDLQTDFEIKKRTFEMETDVMLKIPHDFVEVYEETSGGIKVEEAIKQSQYRDKIEIRRDKMRIKSELFSTFFEGSISCILNHIQELLQKPGLSDVSTILLVGGYSNSPVVRSRIRNKYPDLRVVHPDDSELAILKGAVLFGHEPQAISSRICKYTYGIAMTMPFEEGIHPEEKRIMGSNKSLCDDVFRIHLHIGQKVQIGMNQPEKEYRLEPGHTKGILETYASSNRNPRFVSEKGCFYLGSIIIENDEVSENNGRIFVKLLYSGTELGVEARNDKGKIIKAYYDFLG